MMMRFFEFVMRVSVPASAHVRRVVTACRTAIPLPLQVKAIFDLYDGKSDANGGAADGEIDYDEFKKVISFCWKRDYNTGPNPSAQQG
jgi:hypothetical protein